MGPLAVRLTSFASAKGDNTFLFLKSPFSSLHVLFSTVGTLHMANGTSFLEPWDNNKVQRENYCSFSDPRFEKYPDLIHCRLLNYIKLLFFKSFSYIFILLSNLLNTLALNASNIQCMGELIFHAFLEPTTVPGKMYNICP